MNGIAMNEKNYGPLNALVDIIAAPGKALDAVRQHPRWLWWPLLVSLLLGIGVFVWYFLWVDFPWLVEEVVRTSVPPGGDPAVAEAIRGFMSPGVQIGTTVAAIVLVTLLIYTVQSLYLHLVNKASGDSSLRFGHWFAFSSFTAFPAVFQSLAMAVVILMADSRQLPQQDLMPLSFQSLFVHADASSPWAAWAGSLSLVTLWILALMIFGYRRWTGSSWLKSAIIVLIPSVLVYGIWALVIA